MKKALFLDRDGVVIEDVHLLSSTKDIKLKDGIDDLICRARELDYLIIMVTNQTVVSRGILTYEEMQELNFAVLKALTSRNEKAIFDEIKICPHHPNATVEKYRINCECRKPKAGMILEATKDLLIDLESSLLIGDRLSDIIAGNLAGVTTFLFQGEMSDEPMLESSLEVEDKLNVPIFKVTKLNEVKKYLEQM